MAIEVGKKGLAEVNLIIPQGSSFAFTIVHKDADGNIIDHSESLVKMAFQNRAGTSTYDVSEHCAGGGECIAVSLPMSVTTMLPRGDLLWDIFAQDGGTSVRLAYGYARIVDTYALDGE